MAEGQGQTDRYTPEQVIAALQASAGINMGAAQKLKCSPSTVGNYIRRYPEIAEALEEIVSNTLDLAETQLVKALTDSNAKGHMTALIFYLKTKGKHRGYVERVEQTGRDGEALPGAVTIFQLPDNSREPTAPAAAPNGGAS